MAMIQIVICIANLDFENYETTDRGRFEFLIIRGVEVFASNEMNNRIINWRNSIFN